MKKQLIKILIIPFLLFTALVTYGQDSLINKSFLDNKVHLLVPSSLIELSKDEVAAQFPDKKQRPSVVLSDSEEIVSLKIIIMPQKVNDKQVASYKEFHVSNMKLEDNLTWIEDGIKKINNKDVGFIKVIYTNRKTFSYFFFTSFNGQLLLFVYDCPDMIWSYMIGQAEKIVSSLKIE